MNLSDLTNELKMVRLRLAVEKQGPPGPKPERYGDDVQWDESARRWKRTGGGSAGQSGATPQVSSGQRSAGDVIRNDVSRMLEQGGFNVGVETIQDNVNAFSIVGESREEADAAARWFTEMLEGDVAMDVVGVRPDGRASVNIEFKDDDGSTTTVASSGDTYRGSDTGTERNDPAYEQRVNNIILEQLSPRGANGLRAMVNAKFYKPQDGGVGFQFSGSRKYNYAEVQYDKGTDEYNVTLGYMTVRRYREPKRFEGIQADQLQELFESETGLRTGL